MPKQNLSQSMRTRFITRWAWSLILFITLFVAFYKPILTGIGRVFNYPTLDAAQMQMQNAICSERHGIQLCLLDAIASNDTTTALVEAKSSQGGLFPGDEMLGLVWQDEGANITLDAISTTLPLIEKIPYFNNITPSIIQEQLVFPPIASEEQKVTLTIPALVASVNLNQIISVDVGSDPQPGAVIPVNADIQVLDTTIHFRKAMIIGDGVNSLRLTLDSEPVETVEGITPVYLEMGKPEKVNDLYGNGMIAGSKDLFVELIRPNGKITGVLTLPIVKAVVVLQGPFKFTFSILRSAPEASTPTVANSSDFFPDPTITSLPFDGYYYSGKFLKTGDLLYAVVEGNKTNVYTFTPDAKEQSMLFATIPGIVYHIYLHPDRRGMDYLTGTQFNGSGLFFYRNARLFTLGFGDANPHLLYTFPQPFDQFEGNQVSSTWSFDGRFMVFQSVLEPRPGGLTSEFGWFDMAACRADGNCVPHKIQMPSNLDLFNPFFSPKDYRLLFSGTDTSGAGTPDIFLMEFDPINPTTPIVNLTNSPQVEKGRAIWFPDGRILFFCHDYSDASKFLDAFCSIDPETGNIDYSPQISEHLANYWVSPSGDRIMGTVIHDQATGKGFLNLRLFDLTGRAGPLLASGKILEGVAMSPSEQYVAFIAGEGNQLVLTDTTAINSFIVYSSDIAGSITWMGWGR